MTKNILIFLVLFLAIGLAVLTRFYKLGVVPSGLYIDEAGQGYSAYSILKTGQDEFGMSYPAVFRSFTDFKTPVYIYTIVPLIPLFGLEPFTVRLPSFIFSILTIPILYFLIRKISPRRVALPLSLLTVLLLAVSPWHILFGRTNFECNLALFFFLAGVYTFYLSLKRPVFLLLSAVLFAIAVPAYHSQRFITPAMVLLLAIRHRKTLFSATHKKWTLAAVVVGIIFSLPTLFVAVTPGFLARASGLNIFSLNKNPAGYLIDYSGVFSWVINSRWFLSTQEFLALYISYFSPRQMFNLGDYGPRSSFPELSTFFVWQLPFYLIGLYAFFKTNLGETNKFISSELKFFTLALLLLTPIPAAVTRDPYTTIRALPLVVPQIIIISLGIIYASVFTKKILSKFRAKNLFLPATAVLSVLILVYSLGKLYSSVILLNEYFRAQEWDWGWREVTEIVQGFDSSLPIIVDNSREESYIELAFFLKYDPRVYQKENNSLDLKYYYTDMKHNNLISLGNIKTRPINWEQDLKIEQYLLGDGLSISEEQITRHDLELIREIRYPDKTVAFRIVKTHPPKLQF